MHFTLLVDGTFQAPGIRRPSVRILHQSIPASIALAGGVITDGVWGARKDVLQVLRVLRLVINH